LKKNLGEGGVGRMVHHAGKGGGVALMETFRGFSPKKPKEEGEEGDGRWVKREWDHSRLWGIRKKKKCNVFTTPVRFCIEEDWG